MSPSKKSPSEEKIFCLVYIFNEKLHLKEYDEKVIGEQISRIFGPMIFHECEGLRDFSKTAKIGDVLEFNDYCNFIVFRKR